MTPVDAGASPDRIASGWCRDKGLYAPEKGFPFCPPRCSRIAKVTSPVPVTVSTVSFACRVSGPGHSRPIRAEARYSCPRPDGCRISAVTIRSSRWSDWSSRSNPARTSRHGPAPARSYSSIRPDWDAWGRSEARPGEGRGADHDAATLSAHAQTFAICFPLNKYLIGKTLHRLSFRPSRPARQRHFDLSDCHDRHRVPHAFQIGEGTRWGAPARPLVLRGHKEWPRRNGSIMIRRASDMSPRDRMQS